MTGLITFKQWRELKFAKERGQSCSGVGQSTFFANFSTNLKDLTPKGAMAQCPSLHTLMLFNIPFDHNRYTDYWIYGCIAMPTIIQFEIIAEWDYLFSLQFCT